MKIVGVYPWENYIDLFLIEMTFDIPPHEVDLYQITQLANDMLPWDENYLDEKGEQIISPKHEPPEGGATTRITFFYHFLDLSEPLLTQFGPIDLPLPSHMPFRLHLIIDYQDPDEPAEIEYS